MPSFLAAPAGRSNSTGDDEISFPTAAGGLEPWEAYTVVFWLKLPSGLTNGGHFHRCEGTDTGFHGTELSLEGGRLFFVLKRFWPDNALAVRSRETVPQDRWVQLAASYDGSARARGMQLYVDGQLVASEIVGDHLTKGPENSKTGFSFGALFRSTGLKYALLDDLHFYARPLAPVEVRQLFDGHSLNDAIAARQPDSLKPFYAAALSPSITLGAHRVNQCRQSFL